METSSKSNIRVLMFPWLAYSHIHAFLELAKKLSKRNFYIYLCSTPANLAYIKEKEPSVEFVELHLPSLPELPPHYHTTKGLPRHLLSNLMKALDMSSCSFSGILTALKPDLLISDFLQPWAPAKALSLKIPTVLFMVSAAMPYCFLLDLVKISGSTALPLRSNYPHEYDYENDNLTLQDRLLQCLEGSSNLMLIRSLRELEGKYVDELSVLAMKKIVLVGPLVQELSEEENEKTEIIEWLNKKDPCSVLFVSFGSECYLSREDREELAHGLLLSNLLQEVGVALEIKREQNGKLGREEVAKVVREVVVEETGEQVRRKVRELRERIRGKEDEDMDEPAASQALDLNKAK
uniref:Glycosyltransferase N-terminal domain-containing protein n=1 Tax=Populus trichocarpa TaxID=3694 RepID=B9HL29_POPTR